MYLDHPYLNDALPAVQRPQLAQLTVQEEEQKENVMGLADTDWLQSPPLSTPARTPGPPSRALANNPAAVTAAANIENV